MGQHRTGSLQTLVRNFAQCGRTNERLDWVREQIAYGEKPELDFKYLWLNRTPTYNLSPCRLSLAVAAAIKSL